MCCPIDQNEHNSPAERNDPEPEQIIEEEDIESILLKANLTEK